MITKDTESSNAILLIQRGDNVLTVPVHQQYETAVSGQRSLRSTQAITYGGIETSFCSAETSVMLTTLLEDLEIVFNIAPEQRSKIKQCCELLFSLELFEKLPGSEFSQLYSNILHVFTVAFTNLPEELQTEIQTRSGQDVHWVGVSNLVALDTYIDVFPQLLSLQQYSAALLASVRFLSLPPAVRQERITTGTQNSTYFLDSASVATEGSHVNF